MANPLVELQRLGQSPWHDNISRGLLTSGKLKRMVAAGDITGLTSNPTIFEQAISTGDDYDQGIRTLAHKGKSADEIFDERVEIGAADSHTHVRRLHVLTGVLARPAARLANLVDQVILEHLQPLGIGSGPGEESVDARIGRDPADVEYALATRMEASKDLFTIPAARGHEYVRVSDRGMRTKLGIDATVPFADKARFARCEFKDVAVDAAALTTDAAAARKRLGL